MVAGIVSFSMPFTTIEEEEQTIKLINKSNLSVNLV